MFDFGMRIKELRNNLNLSQSALGEKIGRTKSIVSCYENNTAVPPLEVLVNMAVVFNVSLDYLVGIDKNEMISVSGLNRSQKEILHSLVKEFKGDPVSYPGLSDNEQAILNRLMVEFYKKHK